MKITGSVDNIEVGQTEASSDWTPQPVAYSETEGFSWIAWGADRCSRSSRVHAIKFSNGRVFDTVNGWRSK